MKKIAQFIIIFFLFWGLSGCKDAKKYTDEEHINKISKIIEEKYLTDNMTYELRPLYDYNDKLSFFAVDFSNDTYLYVKIQEKDRSLLWGPSLYIKDNTGNNSGPWRKSKYVENNGNLIEEFEKDELGNDILYYNSHFKVAKIDKETKCYLIEMRNSNNNLIPAIKKGNNYLNLVSMEEFGLYSSTRYPDYGISFIPKTSFNL